MIAVFKLPRLHTPCQRGSLHPRAGTLVLADDVNKIEQQRRNMHLLYNTMCDEASGAIKHRKLPVLRFSTADNLHYLVCELKVKFRKRKRRALPALFFSLSRSTPTAV